MNRSERSIREYWIIAVLVVAAAAWLRLFDLADVPFGWHPDEATKALLARDVLAGKYFPAFFSAFTGREALYVYLEAGAFALIGEHIFVARLLSAFSGILTVALTYALGSRLFNKRVALFGALLLATSLWHVIASRNGYRAVMQPLVQLPVLILLFEGWRTAGRRSLAAFLTGGVLLGLTQYTYTAARFFPILLVIVVLVAALIRWRMVWSRRNGLLLMIGAALFVCIPLIAHFVQNPIDFYGRASQISVFSPEWAGGSPWARLWQSVKESARMFTVWGDINYRFNIAGKPVFGPVDGFLFYGGLALALWRIAQTRGLERLAYLSLFLWLAVMILPMTLSAESLPYYQRAIGVLPVVYFFPSIALDALLNGLRKVGRWQRHQICYATALLALTALFLLGARTGVDYFHEWHLAQRNDDDRRTAMVYVADYLNAGGNPELLYLSTQYIQHPTLALLAPEHYDRVQWFDASQSLPLPAEGAEASYLLLLENAPQPLLLEAARGLTKLSTGHDRFQRPVFEVYGWSGNRWPQARHTAPATWSWEVTFENGDSPGSRQEIALPVRFGEVLSFRGYNLVPDEINAGQKLEFVLFWEILQRPQRHYTFFVHVLDRNSQLVAGYDANTYPTPFWPDEGNELLLTYFPLQLPDDLAAGVYQVEIGVYHQPSGERLPVLQNGEVVADRLLLEPLRIGTGER